MPLIMEPESAFYTSPLLVLDFQSLYPSIMIAYNYCYSTCLGRVTEFKGSYKFGVVPHLDISPSLLEKLRDHITGPPKISFFMPVKSSSHAASSCTQWYYVRQTYCSKRPPQPHVSGVAGHTSYGETGDEARRRRQGMPMLS